MAARPQLMGDLNEYRDIYPKITGGIDSGSFVGGSKEITRGIQLT